MSTLTSPARTRRGLNEPVTGGAGAGPRPCAGPGPAAMEEIGALRSKIRDLSFTAHLSPAFPDTPPMRNVAGRAVPRPPHSVRGYGEPPAISATPAVVNAIRHATGLNLTHTPVPPERTAGPRPRRSHTGVAGRAGHEAAPA